MVESDKPRKYKEGSPKKSGKGFLSWLTSPSSKDDALKEDETDIPWYQTIIPARVRALFKMTKHNIQAAESWDEYQGQPDWSFPMVKGHVYLLDKSGAPNWFPIGPALKFLNEQTANSAVQQFSTYSMERVHHYAMNGESLHSLYGARKLVDVLIHIQDRTFYAHRCVLCTHSDYFSTVLLENDIPPFAVTDVTLKHLDPDLFKRFLHFAYTGDVFVNFETLYPLRRLANILKSKSLKAKLMVFMAETGALGLEEAIRILEEDTDRDSMPMAVEVVKSNFRLVMDDERMYSFSFENFYEIISGDNLCVNNELDAFWAVLFWVAYDYANRVNYFTQLLNEIRFTCMTSLELMDCAKVTEMIKLSEKCKKLLVYANWVCHTREVGIEDPLCLPEHPKRQCLMNTPYKTPTVSEFDQRFLKYTELMSRDLKEITNQIENTKLNAKRVFFAPTDDEDNEEKQVEPGSDTPEEESQPKADSDRLKRRKSSSLEALKEVYVRKELLPEDKEDEQRNEIPEETPAMPEVTLSLTNIAPKDNGAKKNKKTKHDKKKKKGKLSKSMSITSTNSEDSAISNTGHQQGRRKSSMLLPAKPSKSEEKPATEGKKHKKREHSKSKGSKHKHKHKKSTEEVPTDDDSKKSGIFSNWFTPKPTNKEDIEEDKEEEMAPMMTDNIDDFLANQGDNKEEKKKAKMQKVLDVLSSPSTTSTESTPEAILEVPSTFGEKQPKEKGKKKKKKKKEDKKKDTQEDKEGDGNDKKKKKKKKKKKDKNQQNKTVATSEDESLSLDVPSQVRDVTKNKSDDLNGQAETITEMKLLNLSDSCLTEYEKKQQAADALSLWESNFFPVQIDCVPKEGILLPIRQQKISLTKTHEDIQVKEDQSAIKPRKSETCALICSQDSDNVNKNNCRNQQLH